MVYYGFELSAVAIFSLTKIRHDIFMFINRDKKTFKISIFQYDHLAEIDRNLRGFLQTDGDPDYFVESYNDVLEIQRNTNMRRSRALTS